MSSVVIHKLAHVDDSARIGCGTRIWQGASVIRAAFIGKNCSVGSCSIVDGAHLGDGCTVGHGASVNPGVKAGNNVFIGPNATICNDMWPETSKEGFDIDKLLAGQWAVIIGDGATIGANAVVLPGVRVGAGAFVAAGAVVDRNVPDGFLWRRHGYLSAIPEQRRAKRMRIA